VIRAVRTPSAIVLALVAASMVASCSSGTDRPSRTERRPSPTPSTAISGSELRSDHVGLGRGRTLQAWLDGTQLHLTFFDVAGDELPVDRLEVRATSGQGSSSLRSIRFGSGHFVVPIDLGAGPWRFTVEGTAGEGGPFRAKLSFVLS